MIGLPDIPDDLKITAELVDGPRHGETQRVAPYVSCILSTGPDGATLIYKEENPSPGQTTRTYRFAPEATVEEVLG